MEDADHLLFVGSTILQFPLDCGTRIRFEQVCMRKGQKTDMHHIVEDLSTM